MADERRTSMLQDAFNQIARLSGVSLNENRPINPSSNEPASNSVGMELSRRFPSLRMPPGPTSTGPTTSTTLSSYSGSTINSANFDSLEVTFVNVDGLSRRPIAHTCTPSLELPSTYQSFNELSEEFSSLLREKGFWEFDIV